VPPADDAGADDHDADHHHGDDHDRHDHGDDEHDHDGTLIRPARALAYPAVPDTMLIITTDR
jgi:hypothetical protein